METLAILALIAATWTGATMFLILRCYQRATPNRALVRTGMGGTKAVLSAGVLALPLLHEVTWVGMNAMDFEVECRDGDALKFKDGDWQGRAHCVVRVAPHEAAVIQAATTWGEKTLDLSALQPLVAGRSIEALQNAAIPNKRARLGERTGWNNDVQAAFAALETNGLQLESCGMNETPCNPNGPRNAPAQAGEI